MTLSVLPDPGRSSFPVTCETEIAGLGTNIQSGLSIRTSLVPNMGARRYRVKVFSTIGTVDVHAQDMRFQMDATVWEDVFLGTTAPQGGGFVFVGNFGEGTGIGLFQGPIYRILCSNPNAFFVRVTMFELWTQY